MALNRLLPRLHPPTWGHQARCPCRLLRELDIFCGVGSAEELARILSGFLAGLAIRTQRLNTVAVDVLAYANFCVAVMYHHSCALPTQPQTSNPTLALIQRSWQALFKRPQLPAKSSFGRGLPSSTAMLPTAAAVNKQLPSPYRGRKFEHCWLDVSGCLWLCLLSTFDPMDFSPEQLRPDGFFC